VLVTCSMTALHKVADLAELRACHACLIVCKLKESEVKICHEMVPCSDKNCASSIYRYVPAVGLLLAARWRKQVRLKVSR
jgi:hypothetical protein